jgi:protein-S-isoprenylcysteine O-methyltransferase Ste14
LLQCHAVLRDLNIFATVAVLLCWPIYLVLFFRKVRSASPRRHYKPWSIAGILLQFAAEGIVWGLPRPLFSSLPGLGFPIHIAAPITAVILAAGSVWFSWISLRTLGMQWSLVAEVKSEHRLVQEGPYAVVRHPLYVCFLGLTTATALVWTVPAGLAPALVLFIAGVWIRVRTEEIILRETFGAEFDEYTRRVPAFFPGIGRRI